MKRIIVMAALLVVAAFMLALLAAGFVAGSIALTQLLGLQHILGIDTQASKNYDSVSGYLPIVVTALGFSGILMTAWHHLNCHQDKCWRIGRFPVGDGKWKSCKLHHPDPVVKEGVQAHHLQAAHEKHAAGTSVKATRAPRPRT